jgi:hypothetical protein
MTKKSKAGARGSRKRRGDGEAMTGAKAGSVEIRQAIGQEELQLPAPDDYQHHRKSILGALEKRDTANSLYRNALKNAQKAGIDTDSMLEARRIVRANDPKKTANSLNQLAFALQQEGFSIQITVHDTLAGDQMDLVYRRFYDDGKAAKTLENPYPSGSDLALQAARGWRHGNAANMEMSPEQADSGLDEDERDRLANLPPPPAMPVHPAMH